MRPGRLTAAAVAAALAAGAGLFGACSAEEACADCDATPATSMSTSIVSSTTPGAVDAVDAIREVVVGARPAVAPFVGLGEARLAAGGVCRRVAIADTDDERGRGLMELTDLAPYDGMLFAWEADNDSAFTMFQTELTLDIAWYDSAGRPVDSTRMVPCPERDLAKCPLYRSSGRYRYALEVAGGSLGAGALGACG